MYANPNKTGSKTQPRSIYKSQHPSPYILLICLGVLLSFSMVAASFQCLQDHALCSPPEEHVLMWLREARLPCLQPVKKGSQVATLPRRRAWLRGVFPA